MLYMRKLQVVQLRDLKVHKVKQDHKDRQVRKVLPGRRVHRERQGLQVLMGLQWNFKAA
jgi:hypothetical protein